MNTYIIDQHANGSARDAIIIGLVTEFDISINKATKEYATVARAEGWTVAATSHKEDALAVLASQYTIGSWDHQAVTDSVIELAARYDIAESTARDYTKAFSKSLDVVHPVLDPRAAMFEYLIENSPHMSYDELKDGFKAFAKSLGRSPSNINEYWKGYDLHVALKDAGC